MRIKTTVKRAAVVGALFILAAIIFCFVAIQVQQRSLERRATALLQVLRDTELRMTPRANAFSLLSKVDLPWVQRGACPNTNCTTDFDLRDFAWKHIDFFAGHQWLFRAYEILRGRPARIRASIAIIDGVVWEKDFTVFLEVPEQEGPFAPFRGNHYTLIASLGTQSNFYPHISPRLLLHTNYEIGQPGGCSVCVEGWVKFTPFAAPDDVRRLMQVNLSCLTRWRPCRDQSDLIPVAWSEYLVDSDADRSDELRNELPKCGPAVVGLFARDSQNAVIAAAIATRVAAENGESFQSTAFRLVQRLKRADFWHVGGVREARVYDGQVALASTDKMTEVTPGKQFILLFNHYPMAKEAMEESLETCGIVPATEKNLDLVKSRIAEDFRATHPDPPRPNE